MCYIFIKFFFYFYLVLYCTLLALVYVKAYDKYVYAWARVLIEC